MKNQFSAVKSYTSLKPFLNGLSIFSGILFLGLMSCSSPTESTYSSPTEDKTPPTVTISTNKSLEIDKTGTITFTFSEEVTNFTPDDIQLLINGVNAAKGNFVANSLTNYSLDITPKVDGTLTISIPANSFEDLSGNQSAKEYTSNFEVHLPSYRISFKLNGGSFISPQITNLKVVTNTAIEENRLGGILSYPPTGPIPSQAVTRDIFEWRNNGTKYDFSTPVSNDLTLEAVWSNSCGKVETFHPTNNDELLNYVNAAVGADSTTNLNHIDTSAITDMNSLFYYETSFNGEIYCWNTANVNNMYNIFSGANAFNGDISSWNVAKVNNMGSMFYDATNFDQNIGSWNVANVNNMKEMFWNARAFDQDISSWNVANVNNMSDMFYFAIRFNRDISSWNVANVTNMSSMFYNARAFDQNIGSWNVANVNNMREMFQDAYAFDQNIGSWNVANVTTMRYMFYNARAFDQNISSWNVANVTNMSSMFYNARAFDQNISSWNVANVTNMSSMFYNARAFNQNISSWNVANVTTMRYMFYNARAFNQDISTWNVANVNNMYGMFYSATNFDQDLSSWSVSNVASYDYMFTGSAMESKIAKYPTFPSP